MDRTKMKTAGKDFKGGIPTKRVKSGTRKKSHSVKRTKMGRLGKQSGKPVVFRPFMA